MIFSSLQYFFFLPLVVLLYWRTKGSVRMWVLILASYYFYMSWMPVYGLLLFGITLVNWLLGKALFKAVDRPEGKSSNAKWLLWLGLLINLGSLFYYKYANFAVQALGDTYRVIAQALAFVAPAAKQLPPWDAPLYDIFLPLAISFFVFEFVHYLIDIYRGDKPVQSFTKFMVFSAFFPSQIAGPIKRYQDFIKQLIDPTKLTTPVFFEAVGLFIQGLFKKVAIADPVGSLIFPYYAQYAPMSSGDAWLIALGFVIQCYCDFSAYTDMAKGSALLMGIRLPDNFALPLLATNLSDFWRRWHMSLSSWLRDYVYAPLAGSGRDRFLTWRALFITMVVCGMWHGVGWHYAVFGMIQGVALIIHREWRLLLKKLPTVDKSLNNPVMNLVNNFFVVLFVVLTYVVFRAPDVTRAINVERSLFNVGAQCQLWEPILKAGLIPIITLYMLAFGINELAVRYPEKFRFIRDPEIGYAYPFRLAAWTAALILTVAARPLAAVPFVYFQF